VPREVFSSIHDPRVPHRLHRRRRGETTSMDSIVRRSLRTTTADGDGIHRFSNDGRPSPIKTDPTPPLPPIENTADLASEGARNTYLSSSSEPSR
jgi:hypothetical protein